MADRLPDFGVWMREMAMAMTSLWLWLWLRYGFAMAMASLWLRYGYGFAMAMATTAKHSPPSGRSADRVRTAAGEQRRAAQPAAQPAAGTAAHLLAGGSLQRAGGASARETNVSEDGWNAMAERRDCGMGIHQQAVSMEATRWGSTETRWIKQQMQRRAVPKWLVGDRCGLSNAPTASRNSLPATSEFRSPAKSSELLINLPANRGRRGNGVAFENESDLASRRFSLSCLLSCGLQHHPWPSTGTGRGPVLQGRSRDIPSILWSTSEDKPDRRVSRKAYLSSASALRYVYTTHYVGMNTDRKRVRAPWSDSAIGSST
ncbi:hypothetical protein E2P81_ATG11479 [Venturia nashicola]|uniref:Uncharacterized protein n=1 Tax=Venturia nashicola TaxID=86259 RepID=A0A4Z1P1M2_9PEZI|nr:hypothetical protein E6O75_ATG11171 [Venturia nashicola]TLD35360.1 hypothetical protein E2P81_ATG11479 [Venturia nashicola]